MATGRVTLYALESAFDVDALPPVAARISEVFGGLRAARRAATRHRVTVAGDARSWSLVRGRHVVSGSGSSALLAALAGDVNRTALSEFRGFAAHAGVVAAGSDVVAFPGRSGAGKSTLAAACLAAGFSYVSDEALCVEPSDASVVAYAKPLRLTARDGRLEAFVPVATLGDLAHGSLRLRHTIELVRRPGTPRLAARSRHEAFAQLLQLSFNHFKRPRMAFDVAVRLAAESCPWRLEFDDPTAAAEVLRERLGR